MTSAPRWHARGRHPADQHDPDEPMNGLFKRPNRTLSEDDERFIRLYEDTSRDLLAFLLRRCAAAEDAADCLAESYRIA